METRKKTVEYNDSVKTELVWDDYIDYLIETINESRFMKRAEDKPMSAPKGKLDTHLTSRATHERNAADIAKRIAKGLGLNYEYIYAAMLMHDAGHPFSAHEGEEFFNGIGELYNTQYFHHNAKGVEVIINEHICEKAISRIPGIKHNPELRKKLEEEFPYFLDAVVSHDGEATRDDMNRRPENYNSIEEAVRTKVNNSNIHNKYKCVAQLPEGRIAMFADVLSYMPTDIQDRFRLGIHKGFNDDYLELFGRLFKLQLEITEETDIEVAKRVIEEIQMEKIRDLSDSFDVEKNRPLVMFARKIVGEITSDVLDFEINRDLVEEKVNKHILEYIQEHSSTNMSMIDRKSLNSNVAKIKQYISELLKLRSKVVEELTVQMREFFINDLIKTSRETGRLGFSEEVKDLFFDFKSLNYKYVNKTKWDYQLKEQPEAADLLVSAIKGYLIKTGVICNIFYNESIRKQIQDEEALSFMYVQHRDDDEYALSKFLAEVSEINIPGKKYSGGKVDKDKNYKKGFLELFRNVQSFVNEQNPIFAQKYMTTFYAIQDQITRKVDCVLERLSEDEIKSRRTQVKYFDDYMLKEDEKALRELLLQQYGSISNIGSQERRKIIDILTLAERNRMEEKLAVQFAIDYLSGMSDRGFNELTIQTGILDKDFERDSERGNAGSGKTGDLCEQMKKKTEEETQK